MKEITILSGKGGTGKTSVTAALASLAGNSLFCDYDVNAADLYLIFDPKIREEHKFESGRRASVDTSLCIGCLSCVEVCRFEAIAVDDYGFPDVNPFRCEGCRLCERICPTGAITTTPYENNRWFIADTRVGTIIYARMGAGEENSGKLVSRIRLEAREEAKRCGVERIISDGPPGIGCPAIASVTGTDIVLLVIEPSLSALHDAERLTELVRNFDVPLFAVINKSDLNPDINMKVKDFLLSENITLLGEIPFDKRVVEAMVQGRSIVEYAPHTELATTIREIWDQLKLQL